MSATAQLVWPSTTAGHSWVDVASKPIGELIPSAEVPAARGDNARAQREEGRISDAVPKVVGCAITPEDQIADSAWKGRTSKVLAAGLCAHETATLDADISAGLDVHGEG